MIAQITRDAASGAMLATKGNGAPRPSCARAGKARGSSSGIAFGNRTRLWEHITAQQRPRRRPNGGQLGRDRAVEAEPLVEARDEEARRKRPKMERSAPKRKEQPYAGGRAWIAASSPDRVTWPASNGITTVSPRPNGMDPLLLDHSSRPDPETPITME